MKTKSGITVLACSLCAAWASHAQTRPAADHVYLNGKVWTADEAMPVAQAFATRGERILGVGSNEAMRALAGAETAIADLHGSLVVPGFNDAHWHFATLRDLKLDDARLP